LVPQEMNKDLRLERSKLAAFVTRYNAGPRKPLIRDIEAEWQKSPSGNAAPRDYRLWSAKRSSPTATV
jgi:hypothetical protein